MTDTASKIIDEKGGPAVFAGKVGKRPGAVRAWKHRNQFPREAWPEIITAFPDVPLERLIAIESAAAADPAPSEASA